MNDAYGVFEQLRDFFIKYYESPFALRHEALAAERRRLLESEGRIYREPYIEAIPPYRSSGQTLSEAAQSLGITFDFSSFAACGLFPDDLELYEHQLESLTAVCQGNHVVVTAAQDRARQSASYCRYYWISLTNQRVGLLPVAVRQAGGGGKLVITVFPNGHTRRGRQRYGPLSCIP